MNDTMRRLIRDAGDVPPPPAREIAFIRAMDAVRPAPARRANPWLRRGALSALAAAFMIPAGMVAVRATNALVHRPHAAVRADTRTAGEVARAPLARGHVVRTVTFAGPQFFADAPGAGPSARAHDGAASTSHSAKDHGAKDHGAQAHHATRHHEKNAAKANGKERHAKTKGAGEHHSKKDGAKPHHGKQHRGKKDGPRR